MPREMLIVQRQVYYVVSNCFLLLFKSYFQRNDFICVYEMKKGEQKGMPSVAANKVKKKRNTSSYNVCTCASYVIPWCVCLTYKLIFKTNCVIIFSRDFYPCKICGNWNTAEINYWHIQSFISSFCVGVSKVVTYSFIYNGKSVLKSKHYWSKLPLIYYYHPVPSTSMSVALTWSGLKLYVAYAEGSTGRLGTTWPIQFTYLFITFM